MFQNLCDEQELRNTKAKDVNTFNNYCKNYQEFYGDLGHYFNFVMKKVWV